jgi:IstB-like ATP binding protein
LEIVEDRYDKGSIIITSQVPIDRWHDLIGIPTLADAILDRVIHNAYRIELAGESLRKRREAGERGRGQTASLSARTRPWITAAYATAPWKARSARRYPPSPDQTLKNPTFFSISRGPTSHCAEVQIRVRLTNPSGRNIITSIRGSRPQVADIKSEPRPASNRKQWPTSDWNVWPASSVSAGSDASGRLSERFPAHQRTSSLA